MRRALAVFAAAALIAALSGACGEDANPLEGKKWILSSADGFVAHPLEPSWLRFQEGGALEGSTGCNSLGGKWAVDGSRLTLSEMVTTLIGCQGPVGAQEARFIAALNETVSFDIEGETLRLMDSGGAVRLTFASVPDVTPTPHLR